METKVQRIAQEMLYPGIFAEAGAIFRADGIVGIPTETVYGLAAWVESEEAVRKIYEAKGRPSDNPLIVHIWPGCDLKGIVAEIPELAKPLMEAFWPGPMTLVMKKDPRITPKVTGGLDTVAVRMPAHPIAKALLTELRLPLVAPSANTSGRPSPTTAQHVYDDLCGKIPLIIDSGSCGVGVESTVIDVTGAYPVVLRPGAITREMIAEVCGRAELDPAVTAGGMKDPKAVPKAPGMKYKHYAPRAEVVLLNASRDGFLAYVNENAAPGDAVLCAEEDQPSVRADLVVLPMGRADHPEEASQRLYAALRTADDRRAAHIFVRNPGTDGMQLALYNRLIRAAECKITEI